MKIAFVVSTFPAISQTFVLNQITGLLDCGHEVEIFAQTKDIHPKIHEDIVAYRLLQRTNYLAAIPNSRLRRFFKAMYLAARAFPKHPEMVMRCFNVFKYGKLAASLSLPVTVLPFIDKRYDIIHCHFGPNGNLGIFLKEMGAITGKVITTFHGADISRSIKTGGNHVYEKLFTMGDLFLPISNCWKQKLISLGSPQERTVVHRMGIDLRRFGFKQNKVLNDGKVRILTVARLIEKKGIKYGIKALVKLIKRFPNLEYNIAGDGPLHKELNALITNLNLNNNVNLLGWKDQNEISDLMEQSDMLLAPSVTGKDGDQEGIPVVLMEAMARGLPVISTFHSGIPELVINGETGLLACERDIEALSLKLEYLIVHSELREQLRQRARKYVEDNYDINKLNVRLIEIFERILK